MGGPFPGAARNAADGADGAMSGFAADRRRAASRGFTLIELLIALTLVGMLSIILVGGLRFGTRLWETGDRRSAGLAQVEAVQGLLRRQIGQAFVLRQAAGGEARAASFEGGAGRLRFTAPLPSFVGVGGVYRFELAEAETEEGDRVLELVWQVYRPDREDWFEEEGLTRRTLIEGVESLRFRYYGNQERDLEPDWFEQWDSARGLPALIAVELVYPEGDPRPWPDLTVALSAANPLRR